MLVTTHHCTICETLWLTTMSTSKTFHLYPKLPHFRNKKPIITNQQPQEKSHPPITCMSPPTSCSLHQCPCTQWWAISLRTTPPQGIGLSLQPMIWSHPWVKWVNDVTYDFKAVFFCGWKFFGIIYTIHGGHGIIVYFQFRVWWEVMV